MGLFDNPYVEEGEVKTIVGNRAFVEMGELAQRRSLVLLKNPMNPDSTYRLPLQKGRKKIYQEMVNPAVLADYGTVVDSVADADLAILHIQTPWEQRDGDMLESMFHQGNLDFQNPEKARLLRIMEKVPTILVVYMDRPAVMPELVEAAAGVLVEFGAHDDAYLDVLFGDFAPQGKLPFEIPRSMQAVENQKEDVPYDSENPLFPFGFGLSYE